MSAGTKKSVAFIAIIAALVPLVVVAFFAAPMFLPVFRWLHVDLAKISSQFNVPVERLSRPISFVAWYHPRGEGDPMPWQIISQTPSAIELDPNGEDEDQVLVRVSLISGNDGKPPGTTFINSSWKDHYWKGVGLRLPPGALGTNRKRPVILYDAQAFSRCDVTGAMSYQSTVRGWESDDEWPERDDGFVAAEK